VKYKWGCTPQGRFFGYEAYRGSKVFFIFKQSDRNYALWGKTTILNIDEELIKKGREYEIGFSFIHFNPFEPLPREQWVRGLTDIQLVGNKWLMGRYRYIDANQEDYLEELIKGIGTKATIEVRHAPQPSNNMDLNINVTMNIFKKLQSIADDEGRQIDEIVREAIAEWVKGRSD